MKNKKFRVVSWLTAICVISGILSGCGKTEGTGDTDKITVTMWSFVSEDSTQLAKDTEALQDKMLAEKFPDINIKKVSKAATTDYRQEYDKALMAGVAPDIFTQFSYTDIPTRIKNGTIADITDLVDGWGYKKEGKVIDTFDDVISKDGKWYGIPRSAYVKGTLANIKVLNEAGIDTSVLPKTWDEFVKVGQSVTDLSIPRIGYALMGMDWCVWPFTAWVWSAGGDMVKKNSDGTYKIAFNEEPAVDTAVFMNEVVWKYKMTQKNILCGIGELGESVSNGTACFSWSNFTELSKELIEKSGFSYSDFRMMPMPVKDSSIKNPTLAGGEIITFNPKASKETLEAAFKIAEYLYYDEDYLKAVWQLNIDSGNMSIDVPARSDLYEEKLNMDKKITEEMRAGLIEMSENTIPEPYCEHWSDLKSTLAVPLQEIMLTEGISREKVKQLLDDCAKKLYSLYPETFKNN